MDKITRIHIAKVPYEIDPDAERSLRIYLDEIRDNLDSDLSDEVMADIEVRITEILSDRKVDRDDVITLDDIKAVKDQLGLPNQFTSEPVNKTPEDEESSERVQKRLMRSTDDKVIGGVCAGIGAYFDLDANLTRIIFILLTFFGGMGILLYLLLWIFVPGANSTSDKLKMRGLPSTAANLQRYRYNADKVEVNPALRKFFFIIGRIIKVFITLVGLLTVLYSLIAIGFGTSILYTQPLRPLYDGYRLDYIVVALAWLFVVAAIVLIIAGLLRLWRKRGHNLKISVFASCSVLILTLAGLAISTPFVVNHFNTTLKSSNLARPLEISSTPSKLAPSSLAINTSYLTVNYVITSAPIHATYQSLPGMKQPDISIINSDGSLKITASNLDNVAPSCLFNWCKNYYLPVQITVYGPDIQNIVVTDGAQLNIENIDQTSLSLSVANNSTANLNNGYIENVSISALNNSVVWADGLTAKNDKTTQDSSSWIYAPSSPNLSANISGECNGQQVLVLNSDPNVAVINGQPVSVDSLNNNNDCVSVNNPTFPPNTESVPVPSGP